MSTTDTTPASPDAVELEALRRDAERYRWLRERAWYVDSAANAMGMIEPRRSWMEPPPHPDWDEVEERLDALMGGQLDYVSPYE